MKENIEKFLKTIERLTLDFFEKIPVLRSFAKKQYRLKSFVCISVLVVSFLSFGVTYLVTSFLYHDIIVRDARVTADAISRQVFSSMFQLMEKGWTREELERFADSTKAVYDYMLHEFKLELYRGESVERDYGKVQQPAMSKNIENAFRTGEAIFFKSNNVLVNIHPVKAEDKCLSCHASSRRNEVMGVIEIRQDLGNIVTDARERSMTLFLILSPLPLIMAAIIANFLNARIDRSTATFYEGIKDVNTVKDLTRIDMRNTEVGFTEFNRVMTEVRELVEKLKNTAVDKDILEFEIRLLEKFIITSEVVRDWKEYIKHLLLEINKVMETYILFSIFRVNEELYNLEIFWRDAPSEATKEMFERIVVKQIRDRKAFNDMPDIEIVHNVAKPSKHLPEILEEDIEFKTKCLLLDTPQIGGVVGIGVQTAFENTIRSLVIDGILTTLLNVVGSIKAISKYTKDLEYYATRDPLTNLYNQRMFWELLGYEIIRAKRNDYKFSLLVIDLDNFKDINDSYGHAFGDKFLQEFAMSVRKALRQGDILSRYGGDEFTVVLPEADKEQGFLVANRIMESVSDFALFAPDGATVKATTSIGLAIFPDHADNAKDLFIFADNMMYRAKSEGKNKIMAPTASDIVEIFKSFSEKTFMISRAVEQKKIIPYFQPIVNTETGRIECYEVLSRIETESGILSAGDFIEAAERSGVISKLDLIVLEKVFEKFKEEPYDGYLFMNLSPKSLILSDFIPSIIRLSRQYSISPGSIVFEITERDTVKNITLLEKFIDNLKFEGFKFAIDDFGSGFSTFHYVKRFPIDFVKIEGDFIRSMVRSKKDLSIVKTMHMLAKEFNIKTIAECSVLKTRIFLMR